MIVTKEHEGPVELRRLIKRERMARRQTRLRAVLLAMEGRDAPSTAEVLGVGRRTVQEWVARFNAGGAAALDDRPRTGQPKRLSPQQEEVCRWLDESLAKGPGDDRPVLRGPQIRDKIERQFGKKMSLSGAYALLHRLGYVPLRPRPRHEKADPKKQEEFKKAAPLFSAPCAASTPRPSSRSGSRTRPASGSRAR
jgi:putative transposase